MSREAVRELTWTSPELSLIKPGDFPVYYPAPIENPALAQAIRNIGGGYIERAYGYGSAFSKDAAKGSLMDIFVVARNPWGFYSEAAQHKNILLGTTRDPGFHALWSYEKANFHLGNITFDGTTRGIKLWVMSHGELSAHAEGVMPTSGDNRKYLYAGGRLQKAMFPQIFDEATPGEGREIDLAFNQARLGGMWLALGLVPRIFDFAQLGCAYADLSYMGDRRVEQANKSQSLFNKNLPDYERMLNPILGCFREHGIIRQIEEDVFETIASLRGDDVRGWLKECASHAFKTNFFKNTWTMGPFNGFKYGLAKVRRTLASSKR